MFDEFLLLSTALVGMAFIRTARRTELRPRGYTWVLAGVLGLTLVAVVEGSRFIGVVAMALGALLVVLPWCLEWGARVAFARGMLRLAVGMAGLRSTLMLGAGLGRQQEILRGLAVLERHGVDRALVHFRSLAHDTEDGGELALINEQIVSMLLYGQRWDEGITHYEARFHPRYAAMRPALVLGLLRAYGEVGRLERAAALLRALEDGPVGNDPRALGLVSQARLTFLVYAGAASPVNAALEDSGRRLLGLSAASGALFRGIAAWRAGEPSRARNELQQVESLAGRKDDRVVASARRAIGELGDPPVVVDPFEVEDDLLPYVETVARRLGTFIRAAPDLQRSGMLLATPAVLIVMGLGYFALRWLDRGGLGLLEVGAPTLEMLRGGDWSRLWTAGWVHGDPIGLLLDMYTVWLTGPLLERVLGSTRTVVAALLGAASAVWVATFVGAEPGAVLGGGSGAGAAIAAGAAYVLLSGRHPSLTGSARKRLLVPFVLVIVALAGSLIPGMLSVDASWAGLLAAVFVGVVVAMPPALDSVRLASRGAAAALVLLSGWSLAQVVGQDEVAALQRTRWTTVEVADERLALPASFESVTERRELPALPLPIQVGALDRLALRGGEVAQIVVVREPVDPATPDLLLLDPALDAELTLVAADPPEAFAVAFEAEGGDPEHLVAHHLRRNGEALGMSIAAPLDSTPSDSSAARVVLIASGGTLQTLGPMYARALALAGR